MTRRNRPFEFYGTTTSVCATCLETIEAKILLDRDRDRVLLEKWCPAHGFARTEISDDISWYRACREIWNKLPELPAKFSTEMVHGCPYDCGLCPDHQQHSCLAVLEITDACNLRCNVCFAESGPERTNFRPLSEIVRMMDLVVEREGELDVLQISGGEPTLHPDFFEILQEARKRSIKHLMVNTNGLVIAKDPSVARRLAELGPGFEVYLQFDSLRDEVLKVLRGTALAAIHRKALENLEAAGVSTTLVMTVRKGLNDGEIGEVIRHAVGWKCVRGVTLQPVQEAGRIEDGETGRLHISSLRRAIGEQSGVFRSEDVLPVPCNTDSLAMAYGIRSGGKIAPVTRHITPEILLDGGRNTIVFERDDDLRRKVIDLLSTGIGPRAQALKLSALFSKFNHHFDPHCKWRRMFRLGKAPAPPPGVEDLSCCIPKVREGGMDYRSVFRVLIVAFQDMENLDLRALKKSCIHFVQPDGRLIPFESFNLFYRGDRAERTGNIQAKIRERTRQRSEEAKT